MRKSPTTDPPCSANANTSRQEQPRFSPIQGYEVLLRNDHNELKDILGLLIERSKPGIPTHVLIPEERARRVERMLSVLSFHTEETKRILCEENLIELAATVSDVTEIGHILAEIHDLVLRDKVAQRLNELSEGMNANLLDCLGFLPDGIFSRKTAVEDIVLNEGHSVETVPVSTLIPSWFKPKNPHHITSTEVGSYIEEGVIKKVGNYSALIRWIIAANHDFSEALIQAQDGIQRTITALRGDDERAQSVGTLRGLEMKSFIELLKMSMNPTSNVRRKFEAIRLLENAILHFSVNRNPVYGAVKAVRSRIDALLEGGVWKGSITVLKMEPSMDARIRTQEFPETSAGQRDARPIVPWRARRVNDKVKDILSIGTDGLIDNSCVAFDERHKSQLSTVMKMKLYQLLIDKLIAFLHDYQTDFPEHFTYEEAQRRLTNMQGRLVRALGSYDDVHFEIKPVALESCDDLDAFYIAIPIHELLEDIQKDSAKKTAIEDMFSRLALFLIQELSLEDHVMENLLWQNNGDNGRSSTHFRGWKIHGFKTHQILVPDGDEHVQKMVRVPVEFQLLPFETAYRLMMNGVTGRGSYHVAKHKDLAEMVLPPMIGNKKMYPDAIGVHDEAQLGGMFE